MSSRACGILLHPTSLPGRYGIGDLGDEALRFLDFLADARQGLWQVLPLGPTGFGDSPYQSFSAFAGNPLLVSPDRLVDAGLLSKRDVAHVPRFSPDRVEYGPVIEYKSGLLARAYDTFVGDADAEARSDFEAFCAEKADWLETYVLFAAIKSSLGGRPWIEWERPLALRDPAAVAEATSALSREIDAARFAQYLFFSQWRALRADAHERGVSIVGDAPIFVSYDSADVWSHREIFKLDAEGSAIVVAGVPPDYFSETGQLWGNPIYDWRRLRESGFGWWIARIRAAFETVDMLRIDHFRGFVATWEVPADEPTAINGTWVDVPGRELFMSLEAALGKLPILAEDLGVITPEVDALRDACGFPGMNVLQFGFDEGPSSKHLPHNFAPESIVYTGTHDNDTTVGWFRAGKGRAARRQRTFCRDYLNATAADIHWGFIRAAYASVSRLAIVPMQDVLGLGSDARMNRPSISSGNWDWRMTPRAANAKLAHRLRDLADLYGRSADVAGGAPDAQSNDA